MTSIGKNSLTNTIKKISSISFKVVLIGASFIMATGCANENDTSVFVQSNCLLGSDNSYINLEMLNGDLYRSLAINIQDKSFIYEWVSDDGIENFLGSATIDGTQKIVIAEEVKIGNLAMHYVSIANEKELSWPGFKGHEMGMITPGKIINFGYIDMACLEQIEEYVKGEIEVVRLKKG